MVFDGEVDRKVVDGQVKFFKSKGGMKTKINQNKKKCLLKK